MKKFILFVLSVFMCFSLCACNSAELDKMRMDVALENVKTEDIVEEYNENIKVVNEFDVAFKSAIENLNGDNSSIDEYMGFERSLAATISSLTDMLELNEENQINSIETYPFLDDTTGNIIEYIILKTPNTTLLMNFQWENGRVTNYSYEYGA